jgi:hypothetical protein
MKTTSEQTITCLKDEKERLLEDIRRCDHCSTSMDEHSQCYEETAKASGNRSRACFM